MTLVLDIEHLLGVSFAARGPESGWPDWPPQPDRVFSALVAAWGARGENEAERRALEWLETQQAPQILASVINPRSGYTAYVPPNDYELPSGQLNAVRWYRDFLSKGVTPPEKGGHKKLWLDAWNVMPDQRKRSGLKERRFSATRPHDPTVRLIWRDAEPDNATLAALNDIAADTAYVGHSASLTRCRFRDADPPEAGTPPERTVYPGRLAELREQFQRIQQADPANARAHRPRPGHPVRATREDADPMPAGIFSGDWLVLEHVDDRGGGGDMPDIRAAALVAKELRKTLMSGYRRIGKADAIPAVISGHAPDGGPSGAPHLAIVPLAFLGAPYASGAVLGFALVPPRGHDLIGDADFQRAVRAVLRWNENEGRRELTLNRLKLNFALGEGSGRRSLDPEPYVSEARVWASCTPIVLDRHLKATGHEEREEEIADLIRQACTNIGLPEPDHVVSGKHSAIEGSPSAYPSGNAPHWTRWRLPESLASRQLMHAIIAFHEPVGGPVILGAGRFVGLGLFRPLRPRGEPQ
jgi:CRISPR-associated protein Csb2